MKNVEESARGTGPEKIQPRRISIVDDDASIREALKSLMRSVRFNVEAFGSAEEFLTSQRLEETSLLILDVYLPGMNGFDLQSRLNAEGRAIPIIFITAHADEASRQKAFKAGAKGFLAKPVRGEVLFKAIHSALESPRQND